MPPSSKDTLKTALITGASSGLGRDFAWLCARDCGRVVLVARDEARLAALAREIMDETGVDCVVISADLAEPGAPAELYKNVGARGITIDILINNAGFGTFGAFANADLHSQSQMVDVNIRALTELTHLFLPGMIARRFGRILNVASTAAFQPGPLMAVYYATKAYVLSFSEALSNELAGTGVTVTTLCPGPTATEFQKRANINDTKLRKSGWLMESSVVAAAGYRAMQRGRRLVIPGFINCAIAQSVRFTPRALVLRIARFLQNQAKT